MPTMNDEIKKYPVYALASAGMLFKCPAVKSTDDYNHTHYHLHHYIPKSNYYRNETWYKERGIEQKLILLPIIIHEHVHQTAARYLTDMEFQQKYKISRWDLVFNKRYSKY
jgi:hypothetical protein